MNCYFFLAFLALLFLRFDPSEAAGGIDLRAKNPVSSGRSNVESRSNLNNREKRQYYGGYGSYGGYGGYPNTGVGLGTSLGLGLGRK